MAQERRQQFGGGDLPPGLQQAFQSEQTVRQPSSKTSSQSKAGSNSKPKKQRSVKDFVQTLLFALAIGLAVFCIFYLFRIGNTSTTTSNPRYDRSEEAMREEADAASRRVGDMVENSGPIQRAANKMKQILGGSSNNNKNNQGYGYGDEDLEIVDQNSDYGGDNNQEEYQEEYQTADYAIQLGVTRTEPNISPYNVLNDLAYVYADPASNGGYRILLGNFYTFNQATDYLGKARQLGFDGAVVYKPDLELTPIQTFEAEPEPEVETEPSFETELEPEPETAFMPPERTPKPTKASVPASTPEANYAIRLGVVSKEPKDLSYFNDIEHLGYLYTEPTARGKYKIFLGDFYTKSKADSIKQIVELEGHDCLIVYREKAETREINLDEDPSFPTDEYNDFLDSEPAFADIPITTFEPDEKAARVANPNFEEDRRRRPQTFDYDSDYAVRRNASTQTQNVANCCPNPPVPQEKDYTLLQNTYTPSQNTPPTITKVKSNIGSHAIKIGVFFATSAENFQDVEDIGHVRLKNRKDGRTNVYLASYTDSIQAVRALRRVRNSGYRDAYITRNPFKTKSPEKEHIPSPEPKITAYQNKSNQTEFMLQVAAVRKPDVFRFKKLAAIGNIYLEYDAFAGLTRILVGPFYDKAEANSAKKAVKRQGFRPLLKEYSRQTDRMPDNRALVFAK